jgi:hypothetical protein
VQRGAITKSGNAHLRRVLVEAAWTYRHRPNVQGRVLRRQKSVVLSDGAKRIAWKAQQQLHKRFTALAARGRENNVIAIANSGAFEVNLPPGEMPVRADRRLSPGPNGLYGFTDTTSKVSGLCARKLSPAMCQCRARLIRLWR